MKNRGWNLKGLLLLIPFFIITISIQLCSDGKSASTEDLNYIKSLNVFLNGRVIDVYELDYRHNFGIITIDIDSSSIKSLDERSEKERYMGLIKQDLGYFIVGTISDFQLGDSIVVKSDVYDLYRSNNKVVNERIIFLPIDNTFKPYKEINRRLSHIK